MDGESPATIRKLQCELGIDVLHVFVLSSFAVAQPIYDLLGKHPTYFVARASEPIDVVALILALSLMVPAILAGCLLLARALGPRFYTAALAALQIALIAAIALPPARTWPGPGIATLVPVGLGLLFAMAYRKLRAVRLFLPLASPAILVFPIVFIFATPVSKVVFAQPPPSRAGAFSPAPDSHVIFLILDLLPVTALMDEHQDLDAERYPGFARLQAQSVWFRRARTVSGATAWAVPALLTGRYPRAGELGLLEDHPRNLFTLFGAAGAIHAFEPITRLCPQTLCGETRSRPPRARLASLFRDTSLVALHLLLPERLTGRLPPIDSQWGSFDPDAAPRSSPASGRLFRVPPSGGASDPDKKESERERRTRLKQELHERALNLGSQDRLRKFETFLEGLGGPAGRNLSFLHLNLPHGPYVYLASGKRYVPDGRKHRRLRTTPGKRARRNEWGPDPYLVDLAYRRLTHQIMLADRLVGRLLDRLEELGDLERSLVVVTADHGESFEPRGLQRPMADADTVHVPLFIKFPGQQPGAVDDRAVETVDVLPTIVDALGLKIDWQFEGASLRPGSDDASAVKRRKPPALKRDLLTCLRRKLDRVAARSPEIPATGPHRKLIGRQVVDLLKSARTGQELARLDQVKLDQAAFLADVDPGSDFVPAYLTGSVESGGERSPRSLAIAVNGVIRATPTTYQGRGGEVRFAALVAESSFVAGANTWAVFRLQNELPSSPRSANSSRYTSASDAEKHTKTTASTPSCTAHSSITADRARPAARSIGKP